MTPDPLHVWAVTCRRADGTTRVRHETNGDVARLLVEQLQADDRALEVRLWRAEATWVEVAL